MGEWTILVVVVLVFVTVTSAFPFPTAEDLDSSTAGENVVVKKRQEDDGAPDPHIPVLEQLGAKLNTDWFLEDVILAQKLDRINDISKYSDPADNTTIIFERQVLDANKKIIVLKASEDKRGVTNSTNKRTYIVLVQAPPVPEHKNSFYYMVFAYIRDARDSDEASDIQTIAGKKVTVEWDIWDDRSPTTNFHPGWLSCSYTVMFACQINETAIEATMGKDLAIASKAAATTAKPDKSPSSSTTPAPPPSTEVIKADGGADPQAYYDLYGDFDVKWDGKSGRSLFGGSSLFGGTTATTTTKKAASTGSSFFTSAGSFFSGSKKAKKVTKTSTTTTSSSGWGIPGLGSLFGLSTPAGPPAKPASSADAVFGTYYKGLTGTPAIFLPDGGDSLATLFVPDKETYTIHGTYVPGQIGYPDSFTPDNPAQTANVFSVVGTIIPDGMTMASITGGIHGSLTADSFKPESQGTGMWFNPDGPEAKGVWTPYKKPSNATSKPKVTASGEAIIYGVEFPGVAGSSDIFIPDGQGIPGFFVPNDPAHPEIKVMPHGSFVATKPAGHGSFFPDNMKEVATVNQVRGAFMPDGMNLTGAIAGLITKEGNSFVFVVDIPGIDYSYVKSNASAAMWTPFLKPGEWEPLPPPAPAAAPAAPAESPAKKKTNAGFMFGIKSPSIGSLEIFVPDDFPVEGQMIPEDAEKYKPMSGWLHGVGKTPEKLTFKLKDASQIATITGSMLAMYVPDGIASPNGIMGMLSVEGGNKENATYVPEPAGKGYWYIKGKPENLNVWTPFTPPVLPPQPTLVDKMATQPFQEGFYVPALAGADPVFVPEEGAVGCFVPDDTAVPKSCGTYYPEKPGIPAEFVEDTPTLKDASPGHFVPKLVSGSDAGSKFHASFVVPGLPGEPPTFKLDTVPYKGWGQPEVQVQKEPKRTSAAALANSTAANKTWEAKHPSNIAISVGGGFSGFPTNNHGMEALVEPNHPIFKEFLQYKARQDKSIDTNERVLTVNSRDQIPSPPRNGTTYVVLDEYRDYVNERYMLKTTHIKTLDFEEKLEIAIPKAAEKYVKKKKKVNIKLDVMSNANAGANAGAGGGGTAGGQGSGGVKGTKGGKDCKAGWSSTASAVAKAENGSSSQAQANAINGGDAHAMSLSKDGGNATSGANVKDGGKANALSSAANGAQTDAEANALDGGNANALARKSKENSTGTAISNAKGGGVKNDTECDGGGMPDEIEVDSHAAATALSGGAGGAGGNTVNSVANTNVKIDMAGLAAKVMEMQAKLGDDDDDQEQDVHIQINANAGAESAGGSGRGFGGFDDPETQTEKMKRVSKLGKALFQAGIRMQVGWKTELRKIAGNVILEFEREIFYGLGNCPFSHIDFPGEKNPEAIIDFYIKVLRLDCNDKVKPRIMRLFNEGFLKFDDDMTHLVIPAGNEIIKRVKITDSELRLLSAAFEFSTFTSTYHDHVLGTAEKSVAIYEAPDVGMPAASRSVRFFIEMALNFVTSARTSAPHHYVRLTRNLLTTLRTVMFKTYQDGVLVAGVAGCEKDAEMNHHDQVQLMGILQFLVHGTANFEQGKDSELRKTFKQFLTLNRATLESRVKDYDKQAPKQT